MPKEYVGESLVAELKEEISKDDKILIPRAESGRPFIVEELAKICKVDEVKTYKTITSKQDNGYIIDNLKDLDSYYLLFSSPSTFKNFIEIAGEDADSLIKKGEIISIGPVTSQAIKEAGYEVYKQAKTYNYDGIVEMLLEDCNE